MFLKDALFKKNCLLLWPYNSGQMGLHLSYYPCPSPCTFTCVVNTELFFNNCHLHSIWQMNSWGTEQSTTFQVLPSPHWSPKHIEAHAKAGSSAGSNVTPFEMPQLVKVMSSSEKTRPQIYRRLSRCKQLGGWVPALRLGIPLRYNSCELCYPLR